MSLLDKDGKPAVKPDGPTGRKIVIIEMMVKGKPALATNIEGDWFGGNTDRHHVRGRILLSKCLLDAAGALMRDLLGAFAEEEIAQKVSTEIQKFNEQLEKEETKK